MKKLILLLLTVFISFTSCIQENLGGDVIDIHIDISVHNSDGEDLIADNTIQESLLRTYHLINDEYVEYFKPNFGAPRGIAILGENSGKRFLRLYPNIEGENNISYTLIDWGIEDFKRDTFEVEYVKQNGSITTSKITVNNEEVWNVLNDSYESRSITITK